MKKVPETYLRAAQVTNAMSHIVNKWMLGVLLRKLIDASFTGNEDLLILTQPTKPLLNFMFLYHLSFYQVAGISMCVTFVAVVSYALMIYWSSLKAGQFGRKLRSDILDRAVSSSGGADCGNIDRTASDLIMKVRVLEDFIAFDEFLLLNSQVLIALAMICSLVFAWFGGLVAIGLILASKIVAQIHERLRQKLIVNVEKNSAQVNARLLDLVKNGVKIKIMGQLDNERAALTKLEQSSDFHRAADANIKLQRDVFQHYLFGLIPALMGVVGWSLVSNSDPALAVDIGSSILVATLLLEQAHKASMAMAAALDKQSGAMEAQLAIDKFLGKKDDQGNSMTGNETAPSSNKEASSESDPVDDPEVSGRLPFPISLWQRVCTTDDTGITLANVVLCYPDRDEPVLNQYSQSFERGKIHALIGESGSGKSSALKVVADLLRPESGRMSYWNGMKVAYVSQDQKLFARTVRENVTYGAETAMSDTEIWGALKAATMDEWVRSLPDGLDQLLASGEAGVSGGQLQRLNLAHLFCTCQDADLVILDEVLSALDPSSRAILLDQLGIFLRGKTALIITHHHEMLRICYHVHEMPSPKLIVESKRRKSVASSLVRRSGVRTSARSTDSRSSSISLGTSRSDLQRSIASPIAPTLLGDRILSAAVSAELQKEFMD